MEFTGKHQCKGCREWFPEGYGEGEIRFRADPFAAEIHGDDTPMWLCTGCAYERAMDI